MPEFTDRYGDTLDVFTDLDGVNFRVYNDDEGLSVWIDPDSDDPDSDDRETLVAIRDLIEAALGDTTEVADDPAVVRASEISLNEGVLRLAAVNGVLVKFRYAKGDGAFIEDRSLVPATVKTTRDGHVLVTGLDFDRDGEPRAYRLDRIKGQVSIA